MKEEALKRKKRMILYGLIIPSLLAGMSLSSLAGSLLSSTYWAAVPSMLFLVLFIKGIKDGQGDILKEW